MLPGKPNFKGGLVLRCRGWWLNQEEGTDAAAPTFEVKRGPSVEIVLDEGSDVEPCERDAGGRG